MRAASTRSSTGIIISLGTCSAEPPAASKKFVAVAPGRTAWMRTFLSGELLVERQAQGQHERFRSAIEAVQEFGPNGDGRGNIDDRAASAGDKARSHGIGQP